MAKTEKEIMKQTGSQEAWRGFAAGNWQGKVDVQSFIERNITSYEGDESFLASPTESTVALWAQVSELLKEERDRGGVHDIDVNTVSSITSHEPGYIDQAKEKIVGLQTDAPLKRAVQPFGGVRMAADACEAYGYKLSPEIERIFTELRKTHNQGVFDAYTTEMRAARKAGIITGLPDAYGRGRIIGDYRRVALYGVDRLVKAKKEELLQLEEDAMIGMSFYFAKSFPSK
jgi:formate C-acetyltransferase